jgi:hypothetical protein
LTGKHCRKRRAPFVPIGSDDIKQYCPDQAVARRACYVAVVNRGKSTARIKEVVLFDLKLGLTAETRLYGEGYQMLSQSGGTLAQPADLGNYTDAKHYKMPMPADARTYYGLMTLEPPTGEHLLLGFHFLQPLQRAVPLAWGFVTSCR